MPARFFWLAFNFIFFGFACLMAEAAPGNDDFYFGQSDEEASTPAPERTNPVLHSGNATIAETVASESATGHRHFRIGALVGSASERENRIMRGAPESKGSGALSATFLPTPYLGFTALGGLISGVEAEMNLIASTQPLQAAVLLGYEKANLKGREAARGFAWGLQLGLDILDRAGVLAAWRRLPASIERENKSVYTLGAYLKF